MVCVDGAIVDFFQAISFNVIATISIYLLNKLLNYLFFLYRLDAAALLRLLNFVSTVKSVTCKHDLAKEAF